MRLYLSSFRLGNRPDRLVSLVGRGKTVAVIMNALDNFARPREEWLAGQVDALTKLGFVASELDLRQYFGTPDRLGDILERTDAVWINGGNAFLLRAAMKLSGFDKPVRELLAADRIVYAGFSAAVCCAAPTLRGAELVDDPNAVRETYGEDLVWDGLGIIDRNVIVHYRSDHSEAPAAERELQYCKDHGIPHMTLSDGQALVVDGDTTEVVG